jgi:hypothetical protein
MDPAQVKLETVGVADLADMRWGSPDAASPALPEDDELESSSSDSDDDAVGGVGPTLQPHLCLPLLAH